MAQGTLADFKIYDEMFFSGVTEVLQQNANGFNAASANAIRLTPRKIKGQFELSSFFQTTSLINRRDPTSVATVTDTKLTQGEFAGVKVNRRIGPVLQTLDAFKKISMDPQEMSFILGQQSGPAMAIDYINAALNATVASISGVSAVNVDETGQSDANMRTEYLVDGLNLFGDAASRVVIWVTHSAAFFQLMKTQILDKIFGVANINIYQGTPGTLNRPVLVIDSPALVNPGTSVVATSYNWLGLVEGATEVAQSEEENIISMPVTGQDNLSMRIQGEYAFNLSVKGMRWNTGVANPVDSAIASSSNWVYQFASPKLAPGIRIKVK